MSIAVVEANAGIRTSLTGTYHRRAKLTITGLTASADNVVPHGLPYTPNWVVFRPTALGLWGETLPPDSVNIYITVGASGATSGVVNVEE